jgi:hypothetical protein
MSDYRGGDVLETALTARAIVPSVARIGRQ